MRFTYQYRTKANELVRGEICAASRDAAFADLRKQGIRAIRVELAPGAFNKLRSLGKRWWAIVILGVVLAVSLTLLVRRDRDILALEMKDSEPMERSQIYGDPCILQENELAGWTNVFNNAGDCLLAAFAQPGHAIPTNLNVSVHERVWRGKAEDLKFALTADIELQDDEPVENRNMKRIVMAMKSELRSYLSDGGTFRGYCERLLERQREEIKIRLRMVAELGRVDRGDARFRRELSAANDDLRTMGLRTITLTEIGEGSKK